MKEFILIGNGPYARMMKRYMDLTDFGQTAAYAVEEAFIREPELDGLPVLPLEQLKETGSPEIHSLIMGIGYTKMGNVREKIFRQCKALGFSFENYIHPTVIMEKNVTIGEGNNILEGVILEEGVVLGDANLLFGGSLIAHETTVGDYNTFSVKAVAAGCSVIGSHCFIGASATVKDHVTIGDYVLLGAAAYGFKDMEAYSVVVPAKSVVLEGRKSTEFL